ncbi:DNA-3-methyladenine glycosylase [Bombilactobacillus thymidiniphilus]|uniref:DNA-3-methyladenine glycosylase n=1 Tax=Bombilactobacillus thymidiniphilus TaxID=2923363 RepID=UPI0037C04030
MKSGLTGFCQNNVTSQIAQDILGCELVYRNGSQITSGLIVEAEAYLGGEYSTAHAYKGHRSLANEALYADPGPIIFILYMDTLCLIWLRKKEICHKEFYCVVCSQ